MSIIMIIKKDRISTSQANVHYFHFFAVLKYNITVKQLQVFFSCF